MSTSVAQWDPEEVLELGQISSGFTCVGHAYTRGCRCHRPVFPEHLTQATNFLRQLSMTEISSPEVQKLLKQLGRHLLCDLWQQEEQLPRVVREWCDRIERHRQITAEWEQVIHRDSDEVHEWTARLEQSLLFHEPDEIKKTVKLLNLAQKRERSSQAQLADLETLNSDLKHEVDSLRTQLAQSANDPVHSRATPVPSPVRARQPSADSYATFTHPISVEADRQSPICHCHIPSHRIRVQFEVQSDLVAASQQPHPQSEHRTGHVMELVSRFEALR